MKKYILIPEEEIKHSESEMKEIISNPVSVTKNGITIIGNKDILERVIEY